MPNRIDFDDEASRQVRHYATAVRSALAVEESRLVTATAPIQPAGQVWALAAELVRVWSVRMDDLQRWYRDRAAELHGLETGVVQAQKIFDSAEQANTDLARGWVC